MNTLQSHVRSVTGRGTARRIIALFSALLAFTGLPGIAQTTNETATAPITMDFSSFKIITDRNIFDPNRVPHTHGHHESRMAPSVDAFSLAGTMIYQKGRFAFFDGTNPDYRKILEPGGVILGYKVTQILPGYVTLEEGGKQIQLKVGTQMRHEDNGTWQIVANEEPMPETSVQDTEATSSDTEAPTTSNSTLEGNDVLKRLMQQRQQEMK